MVVWYFEEVCVAHGGECISYTSRCLRDESALFFNLCRFQAQVDTDIIFQSGGLAFLMLMAIAFTLLTFNRIDYFFDLSEQLDVV